MNIIQIGCNSCEDHVFDFIKEKENQIQKLIVVDALPKCIESAKSQYAFLRERLTAINVVIGSSNGLISFFFPENDEQSIHSSFRFSHLIEHGHLEVKESIIPCLNVNDFLKSLYLKKIDRLYVDAEGMDVEILLEMNFDKFFPAYLQFEHHHADGVRCRGGEKHLMLLDKLKKLNYFIFEENEYDTIARKI